jgi:hypothetical protein
MPNHMSALGFEMSTADEFGAWQMKTAQNGQAMAVPDGYYIRWEVGQGVELWAQANAERQLVWLNPHFGGQPGMRVGLVGRVPRTDTPLEGAFYGWADPTDEANPESGAYPFVFDMPDALLQADLELPAIYTVQMAAFAHHLDGYADEAAYLAAQEGSVPYAPQSFIPTGLFVAQEGQVPPASAVLTGRVLATNVRLNPVTQKVFYWARVATLGGEVDVVADPEVVVGRLVVGGIVSGAFWLSGRVVGG